MSGCPGVPAGFGQANPPGFGTPAAPGFGPLASPAFGAPASPAAPFGAPAAGSAFGSGFAAAAGQSGVAPLHLRASVHLCRSTDAGGMHRLLLCSVRLRNGGKKALDGQRVMVLPNLLGMQD